MPATWQFSSGLAGLSGCRVLAFNGEENLLRGYSFDILLFAPGVAAQDAPGLLKDLIRAPLLTLTGTRATGESFSRHGAAASASSLFWERGGAVFRVCLRPRSSRLLLTTHSRIFLNMSLPQILPKLLKEEGFTAGADFDVGLRGKYPNRLYTCQYNESSAAFLVRHLERVGAYAYIRQTDGGDVLVLADGAATAEKLPLRDALEWSEEHADESVFSLIRTVTAVPTKVALRDYCTEQPGMTARSAEDAEHLLGGGEYVLYAGCNFYGDTEDAGAISAGEAATALAASRVRAFASKADRAEGESSVPWLQAGYTVTLSGESFQLLSVRHACTLAGDELEERMVRRARQAGFIPGTATGYRNAFVCHPLANGPYAPECESARPVISGLVHAKVDASGNGAYAELDAHGRYQVEFFFPEKVFHTDADDPAEGNRSIPLRMAQAHAGQRSGIHFPLLKGAEVLVAFTDGDPDRPVIVSAIPNPDHPSVIADENQESNMIATPGGHKISLTDTAGKENLTMETPGGHKVVLHDEPGKREIALQAPSGGYIRLREK